jgi:hypothetical protein
MGCLFQSTAGAPFGNCASQRGMDKSPANGGLWLGGGALLSRTRSGQRLRPGVHPAPLGDGYSGSADRAAVTTAKWHCERLIGSIRRECLDHMLMFGERHLRRLLRACADYYNRNRTHLLLDKDSPASRSIESFGRICPVPILGGLHHRYVRI